MPTVRRFELFWPALPPALDGFKTAQISDIHVGLFVKAASLHLVAEQVRAEKPDVFLVTGDVIDDLRQLDETMEALSSVRPPSGSYACLGNHEYYTGVEVVRGAFDRSAIHMLVNEAVPVRTASGATIEISGVDYPMGARGRMTDPRRFAANAARAMEAHASADFRLHLAHHPDAWDAARLRGADLTLSGHTHGGQVTVGGRPLFGAFFRYIRGLYERGEQKLFVHSGTGHWLPLRIACPAEIVVCTLRRGPALSREGRPSAALPTSA